METKIFELRDAATFIVVIAIKLEHDDYNSQEAWLLRRVGYHSGHGSIMLVDANGGRKACSDPYEWNDRTFQTAHLFITERFDTLLNGQVICVETLLNERTEPKISERSGHYE